MSTVQLQGEGQAEGRDHSYLIEDQSVGAYFIQKSAKLEELELPPSPEGQVRRAWCGVVEGEVRICVVWWREW